MSGSCSASGSLRSVLVAAAVAALAVPASAGDKFAYIHDRGGDTDRIRAYAVDATGLLTEVAGSPFASSGLPGGAFSNCATMAPMKFGKQHYLFTSAADGVVVWKIADDGVLTEVPGSPFDDGIGPQGYLGTGALVVGGKLFIYSAVLNSDVVVDFEVQADGTLVPLPGPHASTGADPIGLAAARRTVLTADSTSSTLSAFRVGNDGSLTPAPGSPFTVTGGTWSVSLDRNGRFAYSLDEGTGLHAWSVSASDSTLTELAGSPFAKGFTGKWSGGEFVGSKLFFACRWPTPAAGDLDITVLKRASDGSLTTIGYQTTGFASIDVHAVDQDGKFFLAVSADNSRPNVHLYRLDSRRGELIVADEKQVELGGPYDAEIVEL